MDHLVVALGALWTQHGLAWMPLAAGSLTHIKAGVGRL